MLIDFTFSNFKSFKDEATFSLVAASKLQADAELDFGNVFDTYRTPHLSLLTTAAVYGANASGKSNFVSAVQAFRRCVLESANVDFKYGITPFLFSEHGIPVSAFEMTFLFNAVQMRYGFEISHDGIGNGKCRVENEWLYRAKGAKEAILFERSKDIVQRGRAGRSFPEATPVLKDGHVRRSDALLLSLAAQIGGELSTQIVNYIQHQIRIMSGSEENDLRKYTERCLEDGLYRKTIIGVVHQLDTGIEDIHVIRDEELAEKFAPQYENEHSLAINAAMRTGERKLKVQTEHSVFNNEGHRVGTLDLAANLFESEGTQKLIAFAGPIADTLIKGSTLFIDEMDARFHPLITQALVSLFQNPESNPKHAQLIFITHDTNLLSSCRLRRDQIWFVEKDRTGGSHMYSLADFKGVRSNDPYERNYIAGKYGAIPYIGDLTHLFTGIEPEGLTAHAKS